MLFANTCLTICNSFKMKLILLTLSFLVSGCMTLPVPQVHAQNLFNRTAKSAPNPINSARNFNNLSNIGLSAAASNSFPNSAISGIGIGLSALSLLSSTQAGKLPMPHNYNEIVAFLPLDLAKDETAAQIKMGDIILKAIMISLPEGYEAKIESNIFSLHDEPRKERWLRVNGPLCSDWSCQITCPIPSNENIKQYDGRMKKNTLTWSYLFPQSIGFVKIVNELQDKDGVKVIYGAEILDFDYKSFYIRLSENLPEWVILSIFDQEGKNPEGYVRGIKKIGAVRQL